MDQSLVRSAYEAFQQGNYPLAMERYRQVGSMIGLELFKANIEICRSRYCRAQASTQSRGVQQTEYADPENRIKYSDSFKVALIADEFTTNSFSHEFQTLPIEPTGWQEKFEVHQPDIFFCESAWSGPDPSTRPWKGKIYASKNFPKENRTTLLEIIAYCRKKGIPTIFWNKEDPTHHTDRVHDFVKTAKEFDFVFTTAEECVESYKRHYGVKKVFALPFATNPHLFNPIENGTRSSRVVFAGSWYANHVGRSHDMEQILDLIRGDGFDLEIYDRYHGDPDPLHIWPEKYQSYLKPAQPHDQMPYVYKSSHFGLNFNTVTTSPTMFARRVFELMSSNTLVLSNYSRGTDQMFGDLIVYPDRTRDRLCSLSASEIDEIRARALTKVLSEHTYRHRWNTILEKIGIPHQPRENTVTIASMIHQQADAEASIAWFQQFGTRLPGARLLLVASQSMSGLEVANLYRGFNRFGVTVTSVGHATRYAMLDRYHPVETTHFMTFDPKVPPPSDWLAKAHLHLQYMRDAPIAPASEKGRRFRIGPSQPGATLLCKQQDFGLWLENKQQPYPAYFV